MESLSSTLLLAPPFPSSSFSNSESWVFPFCFLLNGGLGCTSSCWLPLTSSESSFVVPWLVSSSLSSTTLFSSPLPLGSLQRFIRASPLQIESIGSCAQPQTSLRVPLNASFKMVCNPFLLLKLFPDPTSVMMSLS